MKSVSILLVFLAITLSNYAGQPKQPFLEHYSTLSVASENTKQVKTARDVFSAHIDLTVCPYTTQVGPRVELGAKINRFLKFYLGAGVEALGSIDHLFYSYAIIYPYFKHEIEFLNKKHSPFFNYSIGYSASIPGSLREGCGGDCPEYEETLVMPISNRRGGLLFDLGLGYKFSLGQKHITIAPAIKYSYREVNYFLESKSWTGEYWNKHIVRSYSSNKNIFHHFCISLAFGLN